MQGAPHVHLVARAHRLPVPLTNDVVAAWIWRRLQQTFPNTLAAVLMPNHLHLLTQARDADVARTSLATLLGNLKRAREPMRGLWFEPLPRAQLQTDRVKLLRQARYIALNPLRASLTTDPLAWTWSTHRDLVGAIASPWVSPRRIAALAQRRPEDVQTWWHRYLAHEGWAPNAPVARSAQPTAVAELPLLAVAQAVATTLRVTVDELRRRSAARALFLHVASRVGWDGVERLANFCQVTPRGVQKALLRPTPPGALAAAMLCLGDPRLRT